MVNMVYILVYVSLHQNAGFKRRGALSVLFTVVPPVSKIMLAIKKLNK